jgi:hypothetical protein
MPGPAARNTGQVACGGDDPGSGLESWPIKGGSTVVVEWSDPKNGETVWPPAHVGLWCSLPPPAVSKLIR